MQYLLLIYDDEQVRWNLPDDQRDALTGAYRSLVGELVSQKIYLGGNPLLQSSTASSVRVRDGKVQITDGPFAETREQLGGYFLIEAADMDEARAIAARLPGAQHGTVEVRPIATMHL
jgi:hypothetical protein